METGHRRARLWAGTGRVPYGPTRQTGWHMLSDGGAFRADAPGPGGEQNNRGISHSAMPRHAAINGGVIEPTCPSSSAGKLSEFQTFLLF